MTINSNLQQVIEAVGILADGLKESIIEHRRRIDFHMKEIEESESLLKSLAQTIRKAQE